MAGSISETSRVALTSGNGIGQVQIGEVVTVDWTGDSSDGTIPVLQVSLRGYLHKIITNPGSTAPTDNYDIALQDPEDSSLDALATLLADRDTTTTEQTQPSISGATILLAGSYGVAITGNSVNSATGRIMFYMMNKTTLVADLSSALSITGTDNAIVRVDGTTGIQDSGILVDDSDNVLLPTIAELRLRDTEIRLYSPSDGVALLESDTTLKLNTTDGDTDIGNTGVTRVGSATDYLEVDSSGNLVLNGDSSWTANGTVATTVSSLGPAGIGTTTIGKWLTVIDDGGTTYYIPAWT